MQPPRPCPYKKIKNVHGKAEHMTIGTLFAPSGARLDDYLAAYKKYAFDVLSDHPDVVSYTVAKDEKRCALVSVTTWVSGNVFPLS